MHSRNLHSRNLHSRNLHSQRASRRITLSGVVVTTVCLALVSAISVPAIQTARASARRATCQANLTKIGLAIHSYHSAHNQFPQHGTGPTNEMQNDCCGQAIKPGKFPNAPAYTRHQLSALVAILPFSEQQQLWERISNPMNDRRGNYWPAFGPAPYSRRYDPWMTDISSYRCPSDAGIGLPAMGRTNYAVCVGDSAWRTDDDSWSYFKATSWRYNGSNRLRRAQVKGSVRGVFVPRRSLTFEDITDGLSNTIAMGEICTSSGDDDYRTPGSINNGTKNVLGNPSHCRDENQTSALRPGFWTNDKEGLGRPQFAHSVSRRGYRWADFRPLYTQFNTILPPNSEICMRGNSGQDAVASVSSFHDGGAHIMLADGAVIFLTDSIDAGDPHASMVYHSSDMKDDKSHRTISPYGLWGALGTRASGESIEEG